jgi:hypothetical protein
MIKIGQRYRSGDTILEVISGTDDNWIVTTTNKIKEKSYVDHHEGIRDRTISTWGTLIKSIQLSDFNEVM